MSNSATTTQSLSQGQRPRPYSKPHKVGTGLRPNSAGIPYALLLRIEAIGVSNFWASTVDPKHFRARLKFLRCAFAFLLRLRDLGGPAESAGAREGCEGKG